MLLMEVLNQLARLNGVPIEIGFSSSSDSSSVSTNDGCSVLSRHKPASISLTHFTGDDPDRWLTQATRYFDFYSISDTDRLTISSYYLDDIFADWFNWVQRNHQVTDWDSFTVALCKRFRSPDFVAPTGVTDPISTDLVIVPDMSIVPISLAQCHEQHDQFVHSLVTSLIPTLDDDFVSKETTFALVPHPIGVDKHVRPLDGIHVHVGPLIPGFQAFILEPKNDEVFLGYGLQQNNLKHAGLPSSVSQLKGPVVMDNVETLILDALGSHLCFHNILCPEILRALPYFGPPYFPRVFNTFAPALQFHVRDKYVSWKGGTLLTTATSDSDYQTRPPDSVPPHPLGPSSHSILQTCFDNVILEFRVGGDTRLTWKGGTATLLYFHDAVGKPQPVEMLDEIVCCVIANFALCQTNLDDYWVKIRVYVVVVHALNGNDIDFWWVDISNRDYDLEIHDSVQPSVLFGTDIRKSGWEPCASALIVLGYVLISFEFIHGRHRLDAISDSHITDRTNIITWYALFLGYTKSGGWEEAIDLFHYMLEETAKSVFNVMVERGQTKDVVTYGALIDEYCLRGTMTETSTVLNPMLVDKVAPHIFTLHSLLNEHCKRSNMDEAMTIFGEFMNVYHVDDQIATPPLADAIGVKVGSKSTKETPQGGGLLDRSRYAFILLASYGTRLRDFLLQHCAVICFFTSGPQIWIGYVCDMVTVIDLECNFIAGWIAHNESVVKMVVGNGSVFRLASPLDPILRPELAKREHRYNPLEPVQIIVGTWRVVHGKPCHAAFCSWVRSQASNVDILVVGLLEAEMGAGAVSFILEHGEVIVFVHVKKVVQLLDPNCANTGRFTATVRFTSMDDKEHDMVDSVGTKLLSWNDSLDIGSKHPSDICTILYTSGNNGDRNGVILTHELTTTNINGFDLFMEDIDDKLTKDDIYFSFLPLAHIFDRMIEDYYFRGGASFMDPNVYLRPFMDINHPILLVTYLTLWVVQLLGRAFSAYHIEVLSCTLTCTLRTR